MILQWIKDENRVLLRIATFALMIALSYEILLKVSRLLVPSFFSLPLFPRAISALTFVVGAIMVVFLNYFQEEQRLAQRTQLIAKALIGCFLLLALF
jgi:hypothetical protein